jgi:hypothetical protein
MLTLEKVKKSNYAIQRGTKLLCYINSYGFENGQYYYVSSVKDGDIMVKDKWNIEVIFTSLNELRKIFMYADR